MVKDIEFANVDGHSLKLDLYLADGESSPLVVWIHGGGWRGGKKSKCYVTWLTDHGYSVASVSYRLTDKAIFPAQIHDCKGAVRWLRANAEKYGYDTSKIAVTGASAGGHLAALLGTTSDVSELEGTVGGNLDQSSRVDAIVDYYGATDFIQRTKTQPHKTIKKGSIVNLLLGGPADKKVELARLASSAFHVTQDDPPLLILHGKKDDKVLVGQSERIVDVYQQAGLPVTLYVLENSGHGGKEFYQSENRQRVVDFLNQHLKELSEQAG
ncbi:alpha/beta hydrolase [Calycomorphotria hydatis]|uniref:alpha/beta hydrolase n=1 Tax=Calycomorphotria hydatis TaxID=2528027 RepID=UPI001E39F516|nr:alpha/beta hydrolase [Calycomorphotria hydatis]